MKIPLAMCNWADCGNVDSLRDDIALNGLFTPLDVILVLNDDYTIKYFQVDKGHHRATACKQLGIKAVDVNVVDGEIYGES